MRIDAVPLGTDPVRPNLSFGPLLILQYMAGALGDLMQYMAGAPGNRTYMGPMPRVSIHLRTAAVLLSSMHPSPTQNKVK